MLTDAGRRDPLEYCRDASGREGPSANACFMGHLQGRHHVPTVPRAERQADNTCGQAPLRCSRCSRRSKW